LLFSVKLYYATKPFKQALPNTAIYADISIFNPLFMFEIQNLYTELKYK